MACSTDDKPTVFVLEISWSVRRGVPHTCRRSDGGTAVADLDVVIEPPDAQA